MIVIVMGLIGAFLGGTTARKRQGNRKDIAQYATGYGIAFMLVGLVITVMVARMFLAG